VDISQKRLSTLHHCQVFNSVNNPNQERVFALKNACTDSPPTEAEQIYTHLTVLANTNTRSTLGSGLSEMSQLPYVCNSKYILLLTRQSDEPAYIHKTNRHNSGMM
jgi:hypothetical protein